LTYWLLAAAVALAIFAVSAMRRTASADQLPIVVGQLLLALALAALAVVWVPTFLGADAWYESSPAREILLFVLMGLGMLARMVSLAIEERRAYRLKNPGKPVPKLTLDHWELAYPFLSSAICFGALIDATGEREFDVVVALFAFQNGFFWQTILANAKPA
jgi:hypothetical protein